MKRLLFGWRYGILAAGLAVLVLLIVDFNSRMAEWRNLQVEEERVAAQATDLVRTELALNTQIAHATSPAGVLDWAYQDGHMARPGDVLVVPVGEPGPTPVPTPVQTVAEKPVSNFELWLSLFFDPSPK